MSSTCSSQACSVWPCSWPAGHQANLPADKRLWHSLQTLAVVDQDLDGRARAMAEHEQRPAEGAGLQVLPAVGRQSVDAGAEVDRPHGNQDALCSAFLGAP